MLFCLFFQRTFVEFIFFGTMFLLSVCLPLILSCHAEMFVCSSLCFLSRDPRVSSSLLLSFSLSLSVPSNIQSQLAFSLVLFKFHFIYFFLIM